MAAEFLINVRQQWDSSSVRAYANEVTAAIARIEAAASGSLGARASSPQNVQRQGLALQAQSEAAVRSVSAPGSGATEAEIAAAREANAQLTLALREIGVHVREAGPALDAAVARATKIQLQAAEAGERSDVTRARLADEAQQRAARLGILQEQADRLAQLAATQRAETLAKDAALKTGNEARLNTAVGPVKVPGTGGTLVEVGDPVAAAFAAEAKQQLKELAALSEARVRAQRLGVEYEEETTLDELKIRNLTAERLHGIALRNEARERVAALNAEVPSPGRVVLSDQQKLDKETRDKELSKRATVNSNLILAQKPELAADASVADVLAAKEELVVFNAEQRRIRAAIIQAYEAQLRLLQSTVDDTAAATVATRAFYGRVSAAQQADPNLVASRVTARVQDTSLGSEVSSRAAIERAQLRAAGDPQALLNFELQEIALATQRVETARERAAAGRRLLDEDEQIGIALLKEAREVAERVAAATQTDAQRLKADQAVIAAREREARAIDAATARVEKADRARNAADVAKHPEILPSAAATGANKAQNAEIAAGAIAAERAAQAQAGIAKELEAAQARLASALARSVSSTEQATAKDREILASKELIAAIVARKVAAEELALATRTPEQIAAADARIVAAKRREEVAAEKAARKLEEQANAAGSAGGASFARITSFAIGAYTAGSLIKGMIEEAQKLQIEMGKVQAQFDALGQSSGAGAFKKDLLDIAASTGTAADQVAGIGRIMKGAFGDSTVAINQTRQAIEAMQTTGLSSGEAMNSLVGIVKSMGTVGAPSIRAVTDEALHLEDTFGVASKEIITGVSNIGPLAKQFGLTFKETAAIIAGAAQQSGRPVSQISSELARTLPNLEKNLGKIIELYQSPVLKAGLPAIKADIQSGQYGQIIIQLIRDYDKLSDTQKTQVVDALGGARAAASLAAAFGASDAIIKELDSTQSNAGRTARSLAEYHKTLAYAIAQGKEAFRQFGAALSEAGVASAVGHLAEVLKVLFLALGLVAHIFGVVNQAAGGVPAHILEIAAAVKLLTLAVGAFQAEGLIGGLLKISGIKAAGGILGIGRGAAAAGGAAAAAETAAVGTGGIGAAAAGSLGGGLLGIGGATLAGGAVAVGAGAVIGTTIGVKLAKPGVDKARSEAEKRLQAASDEQLKEIAEKHKGFIDNVSGHLFGGSTQDLAKKILEERKSGTDAKSINTQKVVAAAELTTSELQKNYADGTASLTTYVNALNRQIEVYKDLPTAEGEKKVIEATAARNRAISDNARAASDNATALAELGGAGPEVAVENLTKLLESGKLIDPQAQLRAARDLVAAEKQALQERVQMAKNAREAVVIARAGLPIDKTTQTILLKNEMLNLDADWNIFFTAFSTNVADQAKFADEIIHNMQVNGNNAIVATRQVLQKRIDDLTKASNEKTLRGDFSTFGEDLIAVQLANKQLEAIPKTLPTPVPTTVHLDPGTVNGLQIAADAEQAAEDKKAESDAKKEDTLQDRIRKARHALAKALAEGDPVAVANEELAAAQEDLAAANDPAEALNAQAALITAQHNLSKAQVQVSDAFRNVDKAMALAVGDTVTAAQIELVSIQESIKAAQARGDKLGALQGQAQLIAQQRSVDSAALQTAEKDIDFYKQLGQASLGQTIASYEALLPLAAKNKDDYQALLLKINALRKEGSRDLQFDIPADIKLPTLYEARRLNQTAAQGQSYQDNRQVSVQYNVFTAQDHQAALDDLLAVSSGSPRVGASPRTYP